MIPYGNLWFFYVAGLLALPAVALGLCGIRIKWYGMVATLVGVGAIMVHTPRQAFALLGFLAFQTALMKTHLWFISTRGRKVPTERRLAVVLALAPLAVVKVAGLFELSLLGFIGISYFTFRAVQVILEISDGLIKKQPVLDHLYFMTFFPVVLSGPIDRSRRFAQDADTGFSAVAYSRLLGKGLTFILLGAVYKFVIAWWLERRMALLTRPEHPHRLPGPHESALADPGSLLGYMYLYGLNLFFDFAGYSLMAVGLSYLFGIRAPVNFRLPFLAENIKDFWNRWHITLSFWLRDFLYTRLLMALIKRKTFASKHAASYTAYLVNMTAMGLWHGLTLYYVIYGVYHGVLMVLNDLYERKVSWHRRFGRATWYRLLGIIVTFHLVMFGFLIFSGRLIRI